MKLRPVLFLLVGLILIVWGLSVTESLQSTFSELFTGRPSDKAIWLIAAGIVSTVWGLVRLRMSRKR